MFEKKREKVRSHSQVRLTLTPGFFKYSRKLKCHDANRDASFIRQIYCIKYYAHDMLISLTQLYIT